MTAHRDGKTPRIESGRGLDAWPVERLGLATTNAYYRDPRTGDWTPERAQLHEAIIDRLLARAIPADCPEIIVVGGGLGCGKSTLIDSQLAAEHPQSVVIDADKMWLEIPEYEALAKADWSSVGNRTYSELRYLRDAALAEAVARRLNIILEAPGDGHNDEIARLLKREGYTISIAYVDCPLEEAHRRIQDRAKRNPTPEDNLWGSPPDPDFPDKHDYQNVDSQTFARECEERKKRVAARLTK